MSGHRRGAMLFEVLLSVALFVGAGSLCLATTRSLFVALDRAKREHLALDLARSKLAELEAGLISAQDLRGEWSGAVGSHEADDDLDTRPRRGWSFEMKTTRTEYGMLSLVELTVTEITPEAASGGGTGDGGGISVTLRQLLSLRDLEPDEYEADELLEGLEVEP